MNCDICFKTFKRKDSYERHMVSKMHENNMKKAKLRRYTCGCGKSYFHNPSLHRHKQTCPKRDLDPNQHQLESRIGELEQQIEQLLLAQNTEKAPINNTTNNNTTIGTQNNVHITVNAFGKENVDYITNKVCLQIVNQVFNSVPTAAQIVFFNPDHPENHNIKIPNKKEPYAMVMKDDQKWEMMDRKQAIAKMTQKSYNVVEDSYEKVHDKLHPYKRDNFLKFCDKMNDQDPTLIRRLHSELEMKVLGATRGEIPP